MRFAAVSLGCEAGAEPAFTAAIRFATAEGVADAGTDACTGADAEPDGDADACADTGLDRTVAAMPCDATPSESALPTATAVTTRTTACRRELILT